MKKNGNNMVIIILGILLVGVSIVAILALNDTISLKKDNNISENKDNSNIILEKLNGVWGYSNYMILINKDSMQYIQGQYGTDGLISGTISNIKEVSNDKYELDVFIEGCIGNNCMEEKEAETKVIFIEIDTTRNIIKNNNNEYQFITKEHSDNDKIKDFFNDDAKTAFNSSELIGEYVDSKNKNVSEIRNNGGVILKIYSVSETDISFEIESISSNEQVAAVSKKDINITSISEGVYKFDWNNDGWDSIGNGTITINDSGVFLSISTTEYSDDNLNGWSLGNFENKKMYHITD